MYNTADSASRKDMLDKIEDAKHYFSQELQMIISDFIRSRDIEILPTIKAFLEAESAKLNKEHIRLASLDADNSVLDYIVKIFKPIKPILVFLLILLLVAVFFTVFSRLDSFWSRLNFVSFSFSLFLAFLLVYLSLSLLFDNKINRIQKSKWICIIGMIIVPLIALIWWPLAPIGSGIQLAAFILIIITKNQRRLVTPYL